MPAASVDPVKQLKRSIVDKHAKSSDWMGALQVVTTLAPISLLWACLVVIPTHTTGVAIGVTLLMTLFLLRVFVLMHECGHGSLFRSTALNRGFGFVFGVVSGMPQYVWSQHHNYHHATNGNWAKYRGPLAVLSTEEYDRLTPAQRRAYVRERRIWMAPIAGFLYLLLNPRISWIKGTFGLVRHVLRGKLAQPQVSLRAHAAGFKTRYWNSSAEYWHMTWNNIALLSAWVAMSWLIGPALFFTVYIISGSLSGAAGIVLFTVQHNFEHSYASGDRDWCYDTAAIHGTSFLVLPRWLNWFTANIGYHHIHHLSARIPNYRLERCHTEYAHLFGDVRRLGLRDIHHSLQYLLWDTKQRRIVTVNEHETAAA